MENFVVEARFFNPYSPSVGSWDYGFLFRQTKTNNGFRLSLNSKKQWQLLYRADGKVRQIAIGTVPNLNTAHTQTNHVQLLVRDSLGVLLVNNSFTTELDLSINTESGDIAIATGIFEGNEVLGSITFFQDFTAWSLP